MERIRKPKPQNSANRHVVQPSVSQMIQRMKDENASSKNAPSKTAKKNTQKLVAPPFTKVPPGHTSGAFIYSSKYMLTVDGKKVSEVKGSDGNGNNWIFKAGIETFKGDKSSKWISKKLFTLMFDSVKMTRGDWVFDAKGYALTSDVKVESNKVLQSGGSAVYGGVKGQYYSVALEKNIDKSINGFDSHLPEVRQFYNLDDSYKLVKMNIYLKGRKGEMKKAEEQYLVKLGAKYPGVKLEFHYEKTKDLGDESAQLEGIFEGLKLSPEAEKLYNSAGPIYKIDVGIPDHAKRT